MATSQVKSTLKPLQKTNTNINPSQIKDHETENAKQAKSSKNHTNQINIETHSNHVKEAWLKNKTKSNQAKSIKPEKSNTKSNQTKSNKVK